MSHNDLETILSVLGPAENAKAMELVSQLSAAANSALGLDGIDASTLMSVLSIKEAIIADRPFDIGEALGQLREVPEISERLTRKANTASARKSITESLNQLPRDQRITKARELGLTGSDGPEPKLLNFTTEELMALPPTRRLTLARMARK